MSANDASNALAGRRFARRPGVATRRVGGEVLLVPPFGRLSDSQRLYAVAGLAETVWVRLDGTRTTAELLAELGAELEVEPAVLARDLAALLTELEAEGLIEEVEGAGPSEGAIPTD